jgi:hypothetical protein
MQLLFGYILFSFVSAIVPANNISSLVDKVKVDNNNFFSDTCFKKVKENIGSDLFVILEIPCEMRKSGIKRKNAIARYGKQIDDDTFISIEISNDTFHLINNNEGIEKVINVLLKKENLTDLGNVISSERIKINNIEGVKILHHANVQTEQGLVHDTFISYYLFPIGNYLKIKYCAGSKSSIKRDTYFKIWQKPFEIMAQKISITKQ